MSETRAGEIREQLLKLERWIEVLSSHGEILPDEYAEEYESLVAEYQKI